MHLEKASKPPSLSLRTSAHTGVAIRSPCGEVRKRQIAVPTGAACIGGRAMLAPTGAVQFLTAVGDGALDVPAFGTNAFAARRITKPCAIATWISLRLVHGAAVWQKTRVFSAKFDDRASFGPSGVRCSIGLHPPASVGMEHDAVSNTSIRMRKAAATCALIIVWVSVGLIKRLLK